MQFKRQQKNRDVDVNLTPLIDVVFLLLIFFMVSTTFTKETHLKLDLPEASGEEQQIKTAQIELVIDARGQYAIDGRSLVSNAIGVLKTALQETAAGDTSLPLIITADANTPHQAVITAMDAAGQLGFSKLSLTTRQPSAGSE